MSDNVSQVRATLDAMNGRVSKVRYVEVGIALTRAVLLVVEELQASREALDKSIFELRDTISECR